MSSSSPSSSSQPFIRVGRGGAGNWYSKEQVLKATAEKKKDGDARRPLSLPTLSTASASPSASSSTTSPLSSPVYARVGRGGAGNFHDAGAAGASSRTPDAEEHAAVVASSLARAATTTPAISGEGGGRGGAGNLADAALRGKARAAAAEERKGKELQARIVHDVEAGLAMPPPAHHNEHHRREAER